MEPLDFPAFLVGRGNLSAVLVTLALGNLKPLKRAIKDLLFYFAVGLTVITPLLFIGVLHSLYS
jgi:hypothetical protein